jgi:hypothetical protein
VTEIAAVLAATTAVTAAAARYWHVRRHRMAPGQRYLLIVLGGLSVSLLLDVPLTQTTIASATDVPYLARWLANTTAMVAVFSAKAMIVWATADTYRVNGIVQIRWCAGIGVLTAALMTPLLLRTDAALDPDLLTAMFHATDVALGQVLFWCYMAACITNFVVVMRRYLLRSDVRPLMHYGMVTVTLAGVVGVLWLAWNAFVVVMQHIGGRIAADALGVSRTLGSAAVCLIAVGLTLPLWTPWFRHRLALWKTRRTLRNLEPLWTMMINLVPTAAAFGAKGGSDPELILYRRIIDIRDVLLRLMGHVEPGVEERVIRAEVEVGETAENRPSTRIPACEIALAMENFRRGRRPATSLPDRPTRRVFDDISDEAEWLIAIYVAMRSDEVVLRVVDELLE